MERLASIIHSIKQHTQYQDGQATVPAYLLELLFVESGESELADCAYLEADNQL